MLEAKFPLWHIEAIEASFLDQQNQLKLENIIEEKVDKKLFSRFLNFYLFC